jgi:hypothetical protein
MTKEEIVIRITELLAVENRSKEQEQELQELEDLLTHITGGKNLTVDDAQKFIDDIK